MRPCQSPAPYGLGSWGRNASERSGSPIRRHDEPTSHPQFSLLTRANRGVSRPTLAALPRHEPSPASNSSLHFYTDPQRRSLARLGALAPTPIALRPAGLRSWGRNASEPRSESADTRRPISPRAFTRLELIPTFLYRSTAPVAHATRRACAFTPASSPAQCAASS